ncbi:unnamed protein product, partial [Mesorhabditis belari]|uniref:Uncharacterized protein n=1 Tax=Mesorhabditis belari TaxID=2138241 RepID=A0AAF3EYA8_9BILA
MKREFKVVNGAGRSGAFLALDANLELMKKTGQLDVFEYAKTLVNARSHLIDSVDQYMFIYDALAEAVLCNVAPIAMCELKDRSTMYKAKKDRQQIESQDNHENKLLLTLTPTLRIGDCAGGHRLENRGKNRDVMVVPPDHARPYLQTLHGESKDYTYINAVEVDGFTRKSEFIVTEWPKQATIDSFWTLIYDHSCHTVVNLSNQGNNKQFPTFIHNKGKHNYGPFIVEVLNYHQYPQMTSHMVKVMKRPSTQAPHKTSSLANLFKKEQPMKVPTIEGHPAFAPPPRTVPIGQSFRFKPEYRGRYRRKSVERSDSRISRSSSKSRREKSATKWLLPSGKRKAAKSADARPRRSIVDVNDLFKEKGMSDIKRLMNVRKNKSEETSKQIEKLTFMISDIMSSGQSQQQMEAEVRICCVIQVRMWPIEHKVPLSTTGLIDVIKMARSWRKRAPDRPETKPTIVMSHNGVSRCGIYIGANICIDQMDMDHEVDVFHAVKLMRINRPQLIDMKDEYKYLYDVMLHWYMTNPEYRQFDKEDPIRGGEESAHSSRHASNRNSLKFGSRGSSVRERSLRDSRKENNSHGNHSNNILSRLSNR